MPQPHPRRTALLALCLSATTGAALALPSVASAQTTPPPPADCDEPVPSTTQSGYLVADPDCDLDGTPFEALPGATTYTGIADGQAYRIEVPDDWNGDLVVYAHGFRGNGTTVYVSDPQIREHVIERGYAWAASSYQTNGYDVDQGVEDSEDLVARFREVVPGGETLDEAFIHGVSMGGHITAVEVERYPATWAAAYPVCGVLGDEALFDYFLDANVTAAAVAETEVGFAEYAPPVAPSVYGDIVAQQIVPDLFTERPALSEAGEVWGAAVEQRSGGDRPGFDSSFAFWNSFGFAPLTDAPFLFGVYPGLSAGTIGIATGNVAGNQETLYQLDGDPAVSAAEEALNAAVLRVSDDPTAEGIPAVEGTPTVPVLSLHTLGDLFVPFSMEQIYAEETTENGVPFVSRAIRAAGHCDFTDAELAKGFDDLVVWEATGRVPAGDPVLDPDAVAEPTFGCRFTTDARETFVAPACPTFPDIADSVHARAIRSQLAGGVVQGLADGTFGPGQTTTRGQVASVLARAAGLEPSAGGAPFSDTAGSVHEGAIGALVSAGIASGYDDGTFRPGEQVSRGQLASFLGRALGVEGTAAGCFPDVTASEEHAGAVCALAELGIAQGTADGDFDPAVPVTRGQAVSLVDRTFG